MFRTVGRALFAMSMVAAVALAAASVSAAAARPAHAARSLAGTYGWNVYAGPTGCGWGMAWANPAEAHGTNTTSYLDWQWIAYTAYSVQKTGSGYVQNQIGPVSHLRVGYISEAPAALMANDWVTADGIDANRRTSFTIYPDATEVWVRYVFVIYDLNTARWYSDEAWSRAC